MPTETLKIIAPKVAQLHTQPNSQPTRTILPTNGQPPPEAALIGKHRSIQSLPTVQAISLPSFTSRVFVQATRGVIRFTMDGSDPSPDSGFQLPPNWRPFALDWQPGMQLKVVGETPDAGFEYQPVTRNGRWCL